MKMSVNQNASSREKKDHLISTEPTHEFLTTGDPSQFSELARRFLGPEVSALNTHRLPVETDVPLTGSIPVLDAGSDR